VARGEAARRLDEAHKLLDEIEHMLADMRRTNDGRQAEVITTAAGSFLDVTTKSVSWLLFEQRNRRRASGTSPRSASTRACRSASRRWRQDLHQHADIAGAQRRPRSRQAVVWHGGTFR
jgi:hypothetical protein